MSMEDTLEEIRGLRHGMDTVNSGLWVQALNGRRNLFKEAVEMFQVMEAVVHSQEALQLLDLGRDYSSALQCTDQDLSRLLCLTERLPSPSASDLVPGRISKYIFAAFAVEALAKLARYPVAKLHVISMVECFHQAQCKAHMKAAQDQNVAQNFGALDSGRFWSEMLIQSG
ncbi:hypothetical protein BSKO_04833 [Bryopsis sp. KO-2023]|nr:hypothetical protein BSKO_04833 [Bryopsis sp. KO-2023]